MDHGWKATASAAMDRYARGDDAVFPELYDLLAPRLLSFFLRRTRDAARAEDLLQQTFLQIHRARRHFTPGSGVVPWAFAVARRLLIDDLRTRGRREVLEDDEAREAREPVDPGAWPDRLVEERRLVRWVEHQVVRLPLPQRATLKLVHADGLSMAEAAAALGTTVTAVKLRACRANKALRAALGDDVREGLDPHW
jgi:RNA polymerase sigma-70 factor (ECF subfamily)